MHSFKYVTQFRGTAMDLENIENDIVEIELQEIDDIPHTFSKIYLFLSISIF